MSSKSLRSLVLAAALLGAPVAKAASFTWDGTTSSYVLTSSDDFSFTTFTTGEGGLDVTARDLKLDQNLTFGGAFSFTQTGGGGLYQGIDLATASTTITATAITLSGDIGKRNSDGNALTLNTSAANGAINLNVSLGRAGAWYIPSGLTANAGTGTITVSGTNGQGWRSTPVSLTGGAINITAAVSSNAAVTLTNSANSTISGIMSGSMGLTKSGAGTMTMTGRATYTGATIVNNGTLQLNDARSLNGAVTVNSGATLTLQNNAAGGYYQPDALTVNAATVNSVTAGSNRYHGIYTKVLNFGTGTSTVSVPLFINKNGDANAHTLVITTDAGALATVSGVISGHPDTNTTVNSAVTKNGNGTLILTGNSNFKGNFTINGGEVQLAPAAPPGSTAETTAGDMSIAGRLITVNSGATLKIIQADIFAGYNVKTPTSIVLDGGTLWRQGKEAGGALPYFNSLGDVTLRNGAVIRTGSGNVQDVQALAFNGTVTVSGTTGSTIVATGGTSFNGIHLGTVGNSTTFDIADTSTLNDLAVSVQLANKVLGGAATLIKTGAGRMLLSASNAYSGGTTLRAGTLVGSNANAFGGSGTVTINDASTSTSDTSLLIDATAGSVSIARAITVANQGSGVVTLGSATTANSNLATFSGAVTLNKAATLNGGTNGDRLSFTAGITGTGNVTIAGTNRVVFAGAANTYAGTTTINSGATLQLSDGSNVSTSFLTDSQDVTVNGSLRFAKGGNSETIGGLNGSGIVSAIAGSDTLIVGSGNANGTFSGALNNSGAALAFTKTGSGTQTLTGTSNYTGATTISNGTLALGTGGVLGNTAVTISSGATFSTAAGTTTAGSVTVNSGGTLTASGTLSSTLGVTGAATVASGGTVSGTATISSGGSLTTNGTVGVVALASGGTLRGSGSAGAVTVANGTANLIAGTGTTGTLSLSSLTFDGTGTLTIGTLANYTSSAAFAVSGALAINGADVTLALPAGLISNGTYKLISYGTTTADETNFTVSGPVIGARQFGGLSKDTDNNVFLYTISGDSPVWTGANSSAFSGGNNWSLINAGTATDFIANDALLVNDTATGTTVDISGADVAPAVVTFDNSTKDYILQGSNGLSSGSIVKNGTGNLTINNANAATSVSVTAGTLTLGNANAVGTAAVTLSGGTLDLNNQSTSASIVLAGGAIANSGTLNGVISGSGALNKASAGTLTLNAQNTFTGGTTVSNGVIVLGNATDTLANAGAVTVSGGELSLGSNSDTVGAVTLSGGSITGTGALTASSLNLQAGTISAQLAGSGAATKTGAGTVTLSAANSNYSGAVTVSAGTISVGDNAALGTGTVTLNGGDIALSGQTLTNTVSFGGGSISGSGTVSGAISGSSAFTKSGSGTLTISGNKTIGSGISVTGGTLAVEMGNLNSGSYAANIATSGSGIFALSGNSNQTLSGVISGAGSLTKSGNGILTLSSGANTLTGDITISGGTVTITAASATAQSANPTSSGLGNMTVSRTITVDGSNTVLEFNAGDAMGAFGYASPVMLVAKNGGVISRASTGGAFNSIGAITLQEGGVLRANAGAGTIVQSLSLNGNVTVLGTSLGGTIEAVAGSNNGIHLRSIGSSGSLTFDVADTAASADLNVTANLLNPVQVNYLGINATGTTTGIIKTGAGRMVLAGNNSFTGAVAVNAGTLAITGSNATGGAYTVAAGATLSISGSGGIFRGGYAGTSLTLGSGSTLEVVGWNYNESTASLGGLNALATGMVVNGSTIRVTGATATTYGRGVTVNSGGVTLEAATGANWTIDTVNDSNAWVYNSNPTITLNGAGTGTFQKVLANGTGAVTKSGAGTWTLSGANTYSGGTTVSNGTLVAGNAAAFGTGAVTLSGGTLDVSGNTLANNITLSGGAIAGAGTLSGVLSGSGALTKSSNNTLVLSNGSNSYSGGTSLSAGTITVGNDTALSSGAVTLTGGTLDINGRSIANAITLSGGSISGAGTLSGVLSGTGSLAKSSAGTLTLSGVNTYSGTTTVSNGTLALTSSGSLAAESSVSVASGATLSLASGASVNGSTLLASGANLNGLGSLGAVTVENGSANLTAGAAGSGTLTFSSLTFDGTATLNIGALANYTSSAAFAITGNLSQTSDLTPISITLPSGIVTNGTYQLLSFGTTSLDVANFSISGPILGGRQLGTLEKSGNLFQYVVTGTSPKWRGTNSTAFNGGGNWTIIDGDGSDNDYIANDSLLVDDTATGTTLDISGADVTPLAINFTNSTKDFTLQGTHGISGGTLAKSGSGNLTIANANSLTAASIEAGTVTLAGSGALDDTTVTLSGGTLDLNGQTTTASIALAGGTLTGNGTVAGVISGSVGFSKSTAGTLTLSGTNTYTGGTTVSNGVLALGNSTDTLADNQAVTVSGGELALGENSDTVGAVALSSGSITGTGTLTGSSYAVSGGSISAILGGTAALTKSGSGTTTLSAANTYSGGTTVSNGTLAISNDTALGSNSVTISGGTLQLSGQNVSNSINFSGGSISGNGTLSGVISGSTFTKSGNGTLSLSGDHTLASGIAVTGGTLSTEGTIGGGTYAAGIAVSAGATFDLSSTSNQVLSGVISGSGALSKSGTGVLTLTRANTFSGDLTVSGGEIQVNSQANNSDPTATALGDMTLSSRTITLTNGSTLRFLRSDAIGQYNHKPQTDIVLDGATLTRDYNTSPLGGGPTEYFNALGDITLRNGARITANTGGNNAVRSFAFNGTITVDGDTGSFIDNIGTNLTGIHIGTVGGSTTFDVRDTSSDVDLEVSVNLLNAVLGSTGSLVKTGAGTMSLTVANSYSSGTNLTQGTILLGNAAALGSGAVTLGSGTLDLGGLTLTNAVTANGGALSGNGTVSSIISGSGSLTKDGEGTLTLSGTNTFSGGFFLNAGTVIADNLSAFGSGSINLLGGILDLNNFAVTNSILFSGGSLINAATSSSTIVISGEVTAEDINNLPGTIISLGNGATVDLTGLTKDVVITGAPTLTNLASFTGNLAVTGTLDLSSPGNRPTQANLELRAGGLLDFGTEDFAGSINYTGGAVTGAFSGQLVVTGGQAVTLTGNSVPTGRVVVDDNQSVVLDSSFTGTVLLTGGSIASGLANFSGNLELGSGAEINLTTEGSIASANLIIEEGGRLSGAGQVGTATVADGGTLAPGNSPGTQDFGTLTLQAGGSLEAEVLSVAPGAFAGIDYDTVTVSGFLDLTGLSSANRFTIDLISLLDANTVGDLVGFDPQSTFTLDLYTYTFLGANESVSNLFTVSTTQFTSGGVSVGAENFSVFDTGTAIQLVYAPIPEPSTYGLILGGLALAGAAIRRRRAKRV